MRARLLDATVALIAEGGVVAVTFDAVAKRAGASRATVYRKWDDREALIEEALLRFATDWVEVADTGDLRADVVDFLCQVGHVLATPIGRAVINATVTAGAGDPIRELGHAVQDRRMAAFQHRLDRAVEAGELPPVDAGFLSLMLTGPVYLWVTREGRSVEPDFAEQVVDTVLDGLRSR
ncbi:TetR/AcrR family transcriptional regulator [Phycicoccus sp. CSK15P-2]|uniref:TetR/AcrR family transcriptional regulator n=1 Tax=Phycicoccus sp. CSK15P-2 TaxID=2807627 RepID=UPI0019515044|nr:TetR/AcrR family transcriptional regulator [Phycicoccus sp. CSK15P-2]MBM6406100.1 TetR/AcrR family transcriptional regulator [Phycicoccus sp. CSK15P-2]